MVSGASRHRDGAAVGRYIDAAIGRDIYGERGAAREVCELIMRAQGTWPAQLARYDR